MKMQVITDAAGNVVMALPLAEGAATGGAVAGIAPAEAGHKLQEVTVPSDITSLPATAFAAKLKEHLHK